MSTKNTHINSTSIRNSIESGGNTNNNSHSSTFNFKRKHDNIFGCAVDRTAVCNVQWWQNGGAMAEKNEQSDTCTTHPRRNVPKKIAPRLFLLCSHNTLSSPSLAEQPSRLISFLFYVPYVYVVCVFMLLRWRNSTMCNYITIHFTADHNNSFRLVLRRNLIGTKHNSSILRLIQWINFMSENDLSHGLIVEIVRDNFISKHINASTYVPLIWLIIYKIHFYWN